MMPMTQSTPITTKVALKMLRTYSIKSVLGGVGGLNIPIVRMMPML